MLSVPRYITMEELEQALREFGMNDGRDIKEIISEVDGDNVRKSSPFKCNKQLTILLSPTYFLMIKNGFCRMVG